MTANSPEIARSIGAAGIRTNVHDVGEGAPVLLIHGSGPGVSAWANWRLTLPELAKARRVIAPDMVGFGFTERPAGFAYGLALQAIEIVCGLGLGLIAIAREGISIAMLKRMRDDDDSAENALEGVQELLEELDEGEHEAARESAAVPR